MFIRWNQFQECERKTEVLQNALIKLAKKNLDIRLGMYYFSYLFSLLYRKVKKKNKYQFHETIGIFFRLHRLLWWYSRCRDRLFFNYNQSFGYNSMCPGCHWSWKWLLFLHLWSHHRYWKFVWTRLALLRKTLLTWQKMKWILYKQYFSTYL